MEMKNAIDKDGDGEVTKDEFMEAYSKMFPEMTQEEKDTVWTKMDADGSGTLEVAELATFFGFNWEGEYANEMTDEQILEALQMQSRLAELDMMKEAETKKDGEKKKREETVRDATLRIINMEKKGNDKEGDDAIREMLMCCTLGDLVAPQSEPDAECVQKHIAAGTCFRAEDEKGEMALHKLARMKVTDANRLKFREIFSSIIKLTRAQADKAGKKGIHSDINHQDKAGKTPLFMAVEHKNVELIDRLFDMKVDGPDSLLVNSVGWTVMHAAVNTDDYDLLSSLTKHFTPARTKVLLSTADKTGREPLHIAAYKCSEEVVGHLMDLGATNNKSDTAGNTAAKLADRAGRRRSKDVIEEKSEKTEQEKAAGRARRASRDSSESLASMQRLSKEGAQAPAAAPAAA